MIKTFVKKHWPVIAIVIVVITFFAKLFFPPSLFITPDYGRSDLLHFNIPMREILSESLKKGTLPLWEPRIGQGFPVFDEGQVGALFLPNLILFGFLPFWLAFNLGYIVTFLTAAIGTYLLARSMKISKQGSYLAAITFSFSATFVLHIHHYNLIQSASIMPWFFWLFNEFTESKKLIYLLVMPLVISQQIFTGFPQITFYSLLALLILAIYKLFHLPTSSKRKLSIFSLLCLFILLGFLISAIQLNATYTLTSTSKRILHNDPSKILTDFPMTTQNLLTMINPYIAGSPKQGGYPPWQPGVRSVFWENNVYFGIVQLLLVVSLVPIFLMNKIGKQKLNAIFWAGFGILGLMLALGTSAPLYPIFTFPLFSYFRVPARFVIYVFLAAGMLSGIAIDSLNNKARERLNNLLAIVIIAAATLDIFRTWSNYHAIGPIKTWLSQPPFAADVPIGQRIFDFGQPYAWNPTFFAKGWTNPNDYLFYLNFMAQNLNILSNKSQTLAYSGMSPNRSDIIEGILEGGFHNEGSKLQASTAVLNVLDQTSTQFMTTPFVLDSDKLKLVKNVSANNQSIYLYKNLESLPHAFVAKNYETATTIQDFLKDVSADNFNPQDTVILEKQPSLDTQSGGGSVRITSYQNTKVTLQTSLQKPSLVVLTDTFYPGWQATIDGKPTNILAANINSRAVAVPSGTHTIIYNFYPLHLVPSIAVSLLSLLVSIILIVKLRANKFNLSAPQKDFF